MKKNLIVIVIVGLLSASSYATSIRFSEFKTPILVKNGLIAISDNNKEVVFLQLPEKMVKWRTILQTQPKSIYHLNEESVVIDGGDGITVIEKASGKVVSKRPAKGVLAGVLTDNKLLFRSSLNRTSYQLYVYDYATDKEVWEYDFRNEDADFKIHESPLCVFLVIDKSGSANDDSIQGRMLITCLDSDTGKTIWQKDINEDIAFGSQRFLLKQTETHVLFKLGGGFLILDKETRSIIQEYHLPDSKSDLRAMLWTNILEDVIPWHDKLVLLVRDRLDVKQNEIKYRVDVCKFAGKTLKVIKTYHYSGFHLGRGVIEGNVLLCGQWSFDLSTGKILADHSNILQARNWSLSEGVYKGKYKYMGGSLAEPDAVSRVLVKYDLETSSTEILLKEPNVKPQKAIK